MSTRRESDLLKSIPPVRVVGPRMPIVSGQMALGTASRAVRISRMTPRTIDERITIWRDEKARS